MSVLHIAGATVSVLLFLYLLFAMLKPERLG